MARRKTDPLVRHVQRTLAAFDRRLQQELADIPDEQRERYIDSRLPQGGSNCSHPGLTDF